MKSLKRWILTEIRIEVLPSFLKEFKRLKKKYRSIVDDVKDLRTELESNPLLGTDIGGGLRKIRMRIKSKGKGKSGGARVITFNVLASVDETEINLLYIYDKSDMESISERELRQLLFDNGFDWKGTK